LVALLFPGKGSQYVGMGRDLAAASPEARRIFEAADDALGVALTRIMWEGPEAELTATHNAQPAILVHSLAVYRLLESRLGGVVMAAGHSLGEFSAWVAARALAFEDGVRTVRRRGELMLEAGRQRPGAMAAILNLDDATVEQVCRDAAAEGGACVPANYNSPGQLVISGDVAAVERALELARAAGARRAVRLSVSGAFHSPLMEPAVPGLAARLHDVVFSRPAFPVVSNVTAAAVSEPEPAQRLLLEQLTSPVRWTACARTLLDSGARRLVELGPGNVLGGLMRRLDRSASMTSIGKWEEVEAFSTNG
jgi:[acyl-carrier-protein] S-malonyltransferase